MSSGGFKPYLPGILRLIADAIGEEMAVLLARKKGGRVVYVPKQPKPEHALVQVLGMENVMRLRDVTGWGEFLVPLGNIGGAQGRRNRIEALLKQGKSHSEIAASVDVHVRTVERVSQEMAEMTRQLKLL